MRDIGVTSYRVHSCLAGDIPVAEAHDDTVLRSGVLVLVLQAEPQASAVVCLARSPATELDLVAAEIGATLDNLALTHLNRLRIF